VRRMVLTRTPVVVGGARPIAAVLVAFATMLTFSPEVRADPDITPPQPPSGVFVEEGQEWQSSDTFNVSWSNPVDQETAIAIAHYQLCPAVPLGPCTAHQAAGTDISQMAIAVPYVGWFWLRVWLEDAAGNVDSTSKSPQVMLRFDDQAPPPPSLQHDNKWLDGGAAVSPSFVIGIDPGASWPMSGIGGYSVTRDGSMPDDSVDLLAAYDYERFPADYALADLPEGTTVVRLRSVSGSGVASGQATTALVQLDRSPPEVFADDNLPPPGSWASNPVSVQLEAHDQASLSGMAAAPVDDPIEDGGYLTYQLDENSALTIRGGEGNVAVATDGHHVLTYEAFDLAGNASGEKSVSFKIDQTAPTGGFEAQDAADPRRLSVEVADATSGVAGGRIEYRREGQEGFQALATVLDAGRLSARLDDLAMRAGRYEIRALVSDVAGNRTVIDRRLDGSAMALGLPLRRSAALEIKVATTVKRCPKAKRKAKARTKPKAQAAARKKAKKRKCSKRAVDQPVGRPLALAHGKSLSSTGRLTTGEGVPLGGVDVAVEGQARSGGPFVRLGSTRTDDHGAFHFAVPAGPSRTVRYSYDGSNTVKPSTAQLVTKVKAAARLKVNRRRLVNGQSVRFTGRLLGKPIPSGGKLVALQAKVGRQWRTFATPRANARGVFRHRYRFTSTTGVRRYAFRAVIAREAAYPYEAGVSRTVRVTVRGR